MKKSIVLSMLGLILVSCSSDSSNGPSPDNGDRVKRSFLDINIVSPRAGTRAESTGNGVYENGTANENNVNSIRFYFFNADGYPVDVYKSGNNYLPYIDWTPRNQGSTTDPTTPPSQSGTVEKILSTTINLTQPANSQRPSLVLAVINPPTSLTGLTTNPSLSDLRNQVSDYYGYDNNPQLYNNNFVMTNSVYDNESGNIVDATPLSDNNFGESAADTPVAVNIYVERILARVDFSLNLTQEANPSGQVTINGESKTIYLVSTHTIGGESIDIYMLPLGWNIVQTPSASRLIKNIQPLSEWPITLFGDSEPWNIYQYHRSFWAINPPSNQFEYLYSTFEPTPGDDYYSAINLTIPANGGISTTYLQENAADFSTATAGTGPENPTQLVIGAQLVDSEGSSLNIAKWGNNYYSEPGLLNTIAMNLSYYWAASGTEGGQPGTQYTHISASDLQFVPASQIPNPGETVSDYNVFVQLTPAAQTKNWYNNSPSNGGTPIDYSVINNYLIDHIGPIEAWNNGYCYYFITIRHLGQEGFPGYYGIVRNHIYRVIITGIKGLGTPVYDPDSEFIPTEPEDDQFSISAQVNILQWRVVSQEYDITW